MKRLLLISAILAAALSMNAVKTTSRLKVKPLDDGATVETLDTIASPSTADVVVAGYDKVLTSRKESFFVTNNFADETIHSLHLRFDYSDMKGRALHNRSVWVNGPLRPGETLNFKIPSWDSQGTFYYHRSVKPRRSGAVPFDVKITVTEVVVKHD